MGSQGTGLLVGLHLYCAACSAWLPAWSAAHECTDLQPPRHLAPAHSLCSIANWQCTSHAFAPHCIRHRSEIAGSSRALQSWTNTSGFTKLLIGLLIEQAASAPAALSARSTGAEQQSTLVPHHQRARESCTPGVVLQRMLPSKLINDNGAMQSLITSRPLICTRQIQLVKVKAIGDKQGTFNKVLKSQTNMQRLMSQPPGMTRHTVVACAM